jgi:hypothetical protein
MVCRHSPGDHGGLGTQWVPSRRDLAAGLLGGDVLGPRAGADAFVQGVRCKVRTARPDDRAGFGVNRDLGEALRGSRWSKTGPRILSRSSTSPLNPSAKRRRRTPCRITAASVMSGVRPIPTGSLRWCQDLPWFARQL